MIVSNSLEFSFSHWSYKRTKFLNKQTGNIFFKLCVFDVCGLWSAFSRFVFWRHPLKWSRSLARGGRVQEVLNTVLWLRNVFGILENWSLRRGGPLRESLQPQVQTVFIEIATSVLAGFHAGSLSWSNWNFKMLVFVEGGKPENPEKNPRSKDENQQQTQPTCGTAPESNPGHMVRGERSQHCDIPAPQYVTNSLVILFFSRLW